MFNWIPAAMNPDTFRWNVYVKYKKRSHQQFEFKYSNPHKSLCILDMPDKILYLQTRGASHTCDEKFDKKMDAYDYDEVISFDPFKKDGFVNRRLDWVLTSAHLTENTAEEMFSRKAGLKMLMDSGGAQIKFGKATYVDPHHVIECYNKYADIGMALDIAPRPSVDVRDLETINILANVQKKNNEMFIREMRDDLEILNVAHGISSRDIRAWADTVARSEMPGWAIGLDMTTHAPASVFRTAGILYHEFGLKDSQRLHMFGMSGLTWIPAMAWMGKYVENLTSDSSSWLEGSRRRMFVTIGRQHVSKTTFGDCLGDMLPITAPIPCSCEVCALLRWLHPYSDRAAQKNYFFLNFHNLIAYQEVATMWNTIASNSNNLAEYTEHLRAHFLTDSRKWYYNRILSVCTYIDIAFKEGVDVADATVTSMKDSIEIADAKGTDTQTLFFDRAYSNIKVAEKYLEADEIEKIKQDTADWIEADNQKRYQTVPVT